MAIGTSDEKFSNKIGHSETVWLPLKPHHRIRCAVGNESQHQRVAGAPGRSAGHTHGANFRILHDYLRQLVPLSTHGVLTSLVEPVAGCARVVDLGLEAPNRKNLNTTSDGFRPVLARPEPGRIAQAQTA